MNRLYCAAALVLLLQARQAVASVHEEEERLIGWQGERDPSTLKVASENGAVQPPPAAGKEPWVETISWSPRAFVHHNFLTEAECDHLVKLGMQRVTRSSVVDAKTGETKLDDIRTSYGGSFARGEDPVIATIEEKIAEWTHIPPDHGEPMQILRYKNGEKYDAHWDWFSDPKYFGDGDNRLATVLMYLSEVEEGGETALPLAQAIDEAAQKLPSPSECAAKLGIAVRPRKGDALMFFNLDLTAKVGQRPALHASCPTLKGTKWTATKWIHNRRHMGGYDAMARAMSCSDAAGQTRCDARAKAGDCDKAEDMVGPGGVCRKTCKDCVECPQGDVLCGRANMRGRLVRKRGP